jgi:hypothetical protein
MEDPEKLTILRTQDTRRRKKEKKRKNTTQYLLDTVLLYFRCVCLRIVMSNILFYQMSLHSEFRVVMSAAISA